MTPAPRHLLAVWNPFYATDALARHAELLAESHRDLGDDAEVWWGLVRSPHRLQPLAHRDDILALDGELDARLDAGHELQLSLTDYQSLYVADVRRRAAAAQPVAGGGGRGAPGGACPAAGGGGVGDAAGRFRPAWVSPPARHRPAGDGHGGGRGDDDRAVASRAHVFGPLSGIRDSATALWHRPRRPPPLVPTAPRQ